MELTLLHVGHLNLSSLVVSCWTQDRQMVCWHGSAFNRSTCSRQILHFSSSSRDCSIDSLPAILFIFVEKASPKIDQLAASKKEIEYSKQIEWSDRVDLNNFNVLSCLNSFKYELIQVQRIHSVEKCHTNKVNERSLTPFDRLQYVMIKHSLLTKTAPRLLKSI